MIFFEILTTILAALVRLTWKAAKWLFLNYLAFLQYYFVPTVIVTIIMILSFWLQ
ncbi:hypothetical protein [Streptococcus sanguinis]|uniref:hypothetical protein n=1 Tax=Streptococcus sanguinis TaxID=1305 RepID=UPI001CBEA2D0|nr:hypothetical protein [Streptococcus sanguinis]MBZ2022145.1 hypothetical protein [Streptococcus sanguinis]MBZ2071963.1 hypothetical protein [Streptococcus sanguinis]MBZ2073763.1 hypothetical protein [Streptococcus sanguinis]MBZ2081686.1 hypothetical protein [Streptococcus sanguinis]MCC3165767.1 putative membrane protein [Streptococcus sanguinis]